MEDQMVNQILDYQYYPDERHKYEYFWRSTSVFSQWYQSEFSVDGIKFNCAEKYMIYQKAVLMKDEEVAEIILALDEPREMKQQGEYVKNFDQKLWDKKRKDVIEAGNFAKFSQNEELKQILLNTYPKTLVEASPDRILGIGLTQDDRWAWNKKTWRGQNLLGEVLTKVRNKLMGTFLDPVNPDEAETGCSSADSVTIDVGLPVKFHKVHGDNVIILNGGTLAMRTYDFCKAVCFSSRPICINEKVFIRIAKTSSSWSGVLRFGFTSIDPASVKGSDLPSYATSDITTKQGRWVWALEERHSVLNNTLYFYVTRYGDLMYGVNEKEIGRLFSGVSTLSPLWAVLDIYGNTIGIEIVNQDATTSTCHTIPRIRSGPPSLTQTLSVSDLRSAQVAVSDSNSTFTTAQVAVSGTRSPVLDAQVAVSVSSSPVKSAPVVIRVSRSPRSPVPKKVKKSKRHSYAGPEDRRCSVS